MEIRWFQLFPVKKSSESVEADLSRSPRVFFEFLEAFLEAFLGQKRKQIKTTKHPEHIVYFYLLIVLLPRLAARVVSCSFLMSDGF